MWKLLKAYQRNDPAAKSKLEILLLYPGVKALFLHRIAHPLYKLRLYFIARLISEVSRLLTGIEIHPGATIGRCVVIDHGMGVVIGETAEVGDYVLIYQGVTLGGVERREGKRHPTVKSNAILGAGAKIVGPIIIGEWAKVGANAVVLSNVSASTSVGGVPAKVITQQNVKQENS